MHKKDLRYLDELNFKLRKNNDYKHEFEQKLSVSENNKKKALLERERKKIAQQKETSNAQVFFLKNSMCQNFKCSTFHCFVLCFHF